VRGEDFPRPVDQYVRKEWLRQQRIDDLFGDPGMIGQSGDEQAAHVGMQLREPPGEIGTRNTGKNQVAHQQIDPLAGLRSDCKRFLAGTGREYLKTGVQQGADYRGQHEGVVIYDKNGFHLVFLRGV
jgi:hypothetical protein